MKIVAAHSSKKIVRTLRQASLKHFGVMGVYLEKPLSEHHDTKFQQKNPQYIVAADKLPGYTLKEVHYSVVNRLYDNISKNLNRLDCMLGLARNMRLLSRTVKKWEVMGAVLLSS